MRRENEKIATDTSHYRYPPEYRYPQLTAAPQFNSDIVPRQKFLDWSRISEGWYEMKRPTEDVLTDPLPENKRPYEGASQYLFPAPEIVGNFGQMDFIYPQIDDYRPDTAVVGEPATRSISRR